MSAVAQSSLTWRTWLVTVAAAGAVGLVLLAAPGDAQTVPSAVPGPPAAAWAQRPKTARSAPSKSRYRKRRSMTFAGASLPRGGPTRKPSPISRRACSWRRLQELVRYWGSGYDWRKAEAKLNALPQFMTDDRRGGHPLHPRPFASPERAAADHHARLAGIGHRAAQDHRSAHGSDRARRPRRGRFRRRHPVVAGLRLLRQADRHRLGPRPHRASLGGADEAPRATPATSPRAATGALPSPARWRARRRRDCSASTSTCRRRYRPRWPRRSPRRARAGGTLRKGTRGVRSAHGVRARRGTRPTSR